MNSDIETRTNNTKVIVLTGSSGYLGQHVLRELIEESAKSCDTTTTITTKTVIYALHQSSPEIQDAVSSYYNNHEQIMNALNNHDLQVIAVALDITSNDACTEWFESLHQQSIRIDCCIHTAAMSSPGICEQQPELAMATNVPQYYLNGLYGNNPMIRIIALSTDQVYDGNTTHEEPYNELSSCEPCNVYGKTKVALETYLLDQQKLLYPHSATILLRSSIMLGPKAPFLSEQAHTTFLHFCHSRINMSTTYYTDEIRSAIAVSDVVAVILYMIHANDKINILNGIYCMGGPNPINRYEMAIAVVSNFDASTNYVIPVLKKDQPAQSNSVQSPLNISMDSTKLLLITGISKFLSLSDMIVQTFS
jgi:dTDP-4-dehydrorhamnose reductase